MYYHVKAIMPGGLTKTIPNKTEQHVLTDVVIPFELNGIISAKWAKKERSYQAIELRIYKTEQPWDKKTRIPLDKFVEKGRNLYSRFAAKANKSLGKTTHRVFVIMPIQGEKFGTQNDQRIYEEFDRRFKILVDCLAEHNCTAIRIDKEVPLDSLVDRIKEEINKAKFIVADLTEERPSCYFEAGYAEALGRPIIYIASKESVVVPTAPTKIHFDVHMNINYFTNMEELKEKIQQAIKKNQTILFPVLEEKKITSVV